MSWNNDVYDDFIDEWDDDDYFYKRGIYAEKGSGYYGGSSRNSSYSKSNSNASSSSGAGMDIFSLIIVLVLYVIAFGLIIFGFIVAILCPPVGALIIVAGMVIKEKLF